MLSPLKLHAKETGGLTQMHIPFGDYLDFRFCILNIGNKVCFDVNARQFSVHFKYSHHTHTHAHAHSHAHAHTHATTLEGRQQLPVCCRSRAPQGQWLSCGFLCNAIAWLPVED